MRGIALLLAAAALVPAQAGAKPAGYIVAAVADKSRPAEDSARDAARKPARMLEFAGVRPGMRIGELLPGAGYFTRVFAAAVGPKGKVYAYLPAAAPPQYAERIAPAVKAHGNVRLVQGADFAAPEPLDIVWTSQNYHDLHLRGSTAEAVNRAVFRALKPGGVYIVVDHRARPGSGTADVGTLHRIDEASVIAEVLKAGFEVADEDMSLRRAEDDHTRKVFDLHDSTDQFVLKFRKPLRARP